MNQKEIDRLWDQWELFCGSPFQMSLCEAADWFGEPSNILDIMTELPNLLLELEDFLLWQEFWSENRKIMAAWEFRKFTKS